MVSPYLGGWCQAGLECGLTPGLPDFWATGYTLVLPLIGNGRILAQRTHNENKDYRR